MQLPIPTFHPSRTAQLNIHATVHDLGDLVIHTRIARAIEAGRPQYGFHRGVVVAAELRLDALLNRIASLPSWNSYRPNDYNMLVDGPGVFLEVFGTEKPSHCTCGVSISGDTLELVEVAAARIMDAAGAERIVAPMFAMNWYFMTATGLDFVTTNEVLSDVLLDEAYPDVVGGVAAFINRYLDAPEAILVLQGPPGSGKTRLLRAVLGELARRRGGEVRVMSTNDPRALENEQLYIRFLTNPVDVFALEDADHLMRPRSDGNELMQRFLAIADGIVRNKGEKSSSRQSAQCRGSRRRTGASRPVFCTPNDPEPAARQRPNACGRMCERRRPVGAALARLRRASQPTYSVAELYRLTTERSGLQDVSDRTPLALAG